MDYLEFMKNHRRCSCQPRSFVFYKKTVENRIRARGHWMNDFAQLLSGKCKTRKEIRYLCRCANCDVFYFATSTKREMVKNLKYLGDKFQEKEITYEPR